MPCYGTFSIYPEPLCECEDPQRPGVRCERVAHPKWETHVGGGGTWPGVGEAPPLTPRIGTREGTDKAFREEAAKYDRDRGYGNDNLLWGRR